MAAMLAEFFTTRVDDCSRIWIGNDLLVMVIHLVNDPEFVNELLLANREVLAFPKVKDSGPPSSPLLL